MRKTTTTTMRKTTTTTMRKTTTTTTLETTITTILETKLLKGLGGKSHLWLLLPYASSKALSPKSFILKTHNVLSFHLLNYLVCNSTIF